MDKDFRIRISAVDKATAVVRRVKDSFSQITRPLTDMKAVVTSLGRETGLDKVGKSLLDIGSAAGSLAAKMAGTMPLLGGSIGIASLAAAAGHWGDLGAEIGRTAQTMGISTQQLQEFRGAARRADIDVGAMDSALKAIGQTIQGIHFHKEGFGNAIAATNQLHLNIDKFKNGVPDVEAAFYSIADAVKSLSANPNSQKSLLNALGLGEDTLPLFQKGAEGVRELVSEYRKTHGMIADDDIRKATAFKDSLINLGDALAGVGYRLIANASALTEFNDAMTKWIVGGPGAVLKSAVNALAPAAAGLRGSPAIAATDFVFGSHISRLLGGLAGSPLAFSVLDAVADAKGNEFSAAAAASAGGAPDSRGIIIHAPPPPPIGIPSSMAPGETDQPGGKAPTVKSVTDAAAAMSPKVSVEVLFKNAPPGTIARVRTSDGADVPVRVEQSMPTLVSP